MTHDEKWIERYEEAMLFYKENDRKPFRYIPEERNLRSCWKTTNKRITTGGQKPDRVEKFNQLAFSGGGDKQDDHNK